MLTLKQYLADPGRCPKCNSVQIEGDSVDIVGHTTSQRVSCMTCGAVWFDEYHLARCIVLHDDGTEEELT